MTDSAPVRPRPAPKEPGEISGNLPETFRISLDVLLYTRGRNDRECIVAGLMMRARNRPIVGKGG
jgi:hypothetical protein